MHRFALPLGKSALRPRSQWQPGSILAFGACCKRATLEAPFAALA